MKLLKICLVILCLLPVRVVGTPRFSGANFFMKEIKLTHGHVALVDDEDYEFLIKVKWHTKFIKDSNLKYAAGAKGYRDENGNKKTKGFQMHRIILGLTDMAV